MNSPRRSAPGEPRLERWVPALIVTGIVLTGLALSSEPATLTPPGRWVDSTQWVTGGLEMTFASALPGVTISSPSNTSVYGMYAGVRAVAELTPEGTPLATAWFNGSTWQHRSLSSESGLEFGYSSIVPVTGTGSGRTVADVAVSFSVPGPAGAFATVGAEVTIQSWPWVQPGDELALLFPVWPSNASDSHLAIDPAGLSLECVANDSGTVLEYVAWNATGTALQGSGSTRQLPADPNMTFASSRAFVWIEFAGDAQGFTSLEYSLSAGVTSPPAPAPLTLPDVTAILAGAGSVIVLLSVAMRVAWQRPPSLL